MSETDQSPDHMFIQEPDRNFQRFFADTARIESTRDIMRIYFGQQTTNPDRTCTTYTEQLGVAVSPMFVKELADMLLDVIVTYEDRYGPVPTDPKVMVRLGKSLHRLKDERRTGESHG